MDFILQLGYFRVTARFFGLDGYPDELVEWVSEQLRLPIDEVILHQYVSSRTVYHHRQVILGHLGHTAFSDEHTDQLAEEARRLAHLQTRPTLLLDALAGYLREHRIEIPAYNALRIVPTQALDTYQDSLEALIEQHLTPQARRMLINLPQKQSRTSRRQTAGRKTATDSTRQYYWLTKLKPITQSMQPRSVAERVELFRQLKPSSPSSPRSSFIVQLNLPDNSIRYYAHNMCLTPGRLKVSCDKANAMCA